MRPYNHVVVGYRRVPFSHPESVGSSQLRVDVEPLDSRYDAMRNVGKEKFSALIVRVDDTILVRVPLRRQ